MWLFALLSHEIWQDTKIALDDLEEINNDAKDAGITKKTFPFKEVRKYLEIVPGKIQIRTTLAQKSPFHQ